MEFWGVEVKAGHAVNVDPGVGKYLHLSQVALGEVKKDKGSEKGSENVPVFVKVDDQKIVLATLSLEKYPHTSLDLMFEKEFELSHNWKKGSVYFSGYRADDTEVGGNSYDTDSDEEEELSLIPIENGKREVKDGHPKPSAAEANAGKPESSAVKPKVQIVEPKKAKVEDNEDDDSDDEDDESDDEDDESDDDMVEAGVDSDDEDEDSDEDEDESSEGEDEATPKKTEASKKRPVESAKKTPLEKKPKLATPSGQKTGADGKKGAHIATPYPSKQVGKTPANDNKSKQQSPKSGGQFACVTCNKTFNSDIGLQSHTKAKHSAGK